MNYADFEVTTGDIDWNRDPVFLAEDGTWAFYDETWANWTGGFQSEAEARKELDEYAESLG